MNSISQLVNKFTNSKFALSLFFAFLSSAACMIMCDLRTSNILIVILVPALYLLFKMGLEIKDRQILTPAFIVSGIYAFAVFLFRLDDVLKTTRKAAAILLLILFFGIFSLFSCLIAIGYSKLRSVCLFECDDQKQRFSNAAVFFISMGIMLLCWMPYFLRFFPGVSSPDSNTQLKQAVGLSPLSDHHPIVHTMMIKIVFELGLSIFNGNETYAFALYSIVQAIMMSSCFSFLVETLYKQKAKKLVLWFVTAFFALVPYHGAYSITMWKDIPFGGIVLVFCTVLWRLIVHYKSGVSSFPVFDSVLLFITGIGVCLFRSNGLYAFFVIIPVFVFCFWNKSKIICTIPLISLMLALIVKYPIYNSMSIRPPDTIESLSIPAQHISRAICDGAELTDEQYVLLSKVVDVEQIPQVYSPHISDPIKNLVRKTGDQQYLKEHKGEYFKLWLEMGLADPYSYLQAQVDQTYGYWYPDEQYWIISDGMINTGMNYSRQPLLPDSLCVITDDVLGSYKCIPFIGLLWSIGTFTWLCLFSLGLCFAKKAKELFIVYLPHLAIIATLLIATPVHAEFRYAYCVFTTMPLLCVIPLHKANKDEAGERSNI